MVEIVFIHRTDPSFLNESNWEHLECTTVLIQKGVINPEIYIVDLFTISGLCSSKSEARRLIRDGGAYVDGIRVTNIEATESAYIGDWVILRKGKKKFHKIKFDTEKDTYNERIS